MPTENKQAEPAFNLDTPDGGRGYIANLFKTVLKRHDYRQYISERLAGDFACTLAQHFEDITAREAALQHRLTAADERVDVLEGLLFEYRNYRQATLQEMADLRDRADAALNPTAEGCVHEFIPFTEGCSKCGEPYTAEGASHE